MVDAKVELIASLSTLNEAVLAKLDGLGEYDLRRPLTPTGTNMLGIVKHLASVQAGYFGDVFGRPWPEPLPWLATDAEINVDMYATADETSDWVRTFYRRSWDHARETFVLRLTTVPVPPVSVWRAADLPTLRISLKNLVRSAPSSVHLVSGMASCNPEADRDASIQGGLLSGTAVPTIDALISAAGPSGVSDHRCVR